ncbi:MAG: helix-turn-helix transcriptional regulator [Actinobacteria bacterium]|nr:helix-turn-helix transcriptional regulator [Actinomycetota bacterium]
MAIREFRKERDVTQEGLASEAGTTLRPLSLIERGRANPTWSTIRGIAGALGASVSDLAKQRSGSEGTVDG